MKLIVLVGPVLLLIVSCKRSVPVNATFTPARSNTNAPSIPRITKPNIADWEPVVKGRPYQLSLMNHVLGFCDSTGSQQLDLANGQQTVGAASCVPKKIIAQNSCDNEADIVSLPDGPYDTVSAGRFSYRLHGHVRDCARDGGVVIVSTTGDVDVIDYGANKIAFLNADLPDSVAIGSGWIAWNSLDQKAPLHLETVTEALEHASAPKQE